MKKIVNNLIKEEWINGVVMMSPRPACNHMILESDIGDELKRYFKKSCIVSTESALYLTKDNPIELKKDAIKLKALVNKKKAELVPDIAVYCDKNQMFKRGFLGIPQLIVEVISPSNSEDDTVRKRATYEEYGVPEYWIASYISGIVFVHVLEDNRYVLKCEYKFLEEVVKSERFKDLTVDVRDIYFYEDNDEDEI